MIQHTEDCNDLMTGRALRQIVEARGPRGPFAISLPELTSRRDMMRAYEDAGRCDCAKLALGRVQADLTQARKQFRAGLAGSERVAELVAVRDELRAIVAGDR